MSSAAEDKINVFHDQKKEFFRFENGETAWLFEITNGVISAKISDFGGVIYSLKVPDKDGDLVDVILGCQDPNLYQNKVLYFGSLIGRCANRIKSGRFSIGRIKYQLAKNDKGINALHGDSEFSHNLWQVENWTRNQLVLNFFSPALAYGYPGNLWIKVTYTITDDNSFEIDYWAKSDEKTIVNLTNHAYFNLSGDGDILNHEFMLRSDFLTETDDELIPTGKLKSVDGTLYDFRTPKKFGEVLPYLTQKNGLDDNFVLNKDYESLPAGIAYSPDSGIEMSYYTSDIGVQIFTANRYKLPIVLKNGKEAPVWGGFCLESQHFPDSPNHKNFPSILLNAGESYHQTTRFKFKVR